jgi:hypothetical protein
VPIRRFWQATREPWLIAFTTASSEAADVVLTVDRIDALAGSQRVVQLDRAVGRDVQLVAELAEVGDPGTGHRDARDLDGADAVHVQRFHVGDDVGAVADLVLHRLLVAEVHTHRLALPRRHAPTRNTGVFRRRPRSGWVRP